MISVDKISSVLDAKESLPVTPRPEVKELAVQVENDTKKFVEKVKVNQQADYDEARANYREMIQQTMEVIPDLIDLVKEAESPRMYEAASGFIKMVSELNKDLLELSSQKETKDGRKEEVREPSLPASTGQEQVVFVGTPEEFFEELDRLERQKDPRIIDVQ